MRLPLLLCLLALAVPADHQPTARFPKGTSAMALGPPPSSVPSWALTSCKPCHPAQTRDFEQSGHAQAAESYVFQAAVTKEEPGFCLRCHAPQGRPGHQVADEGAKTAEDRGVSCGACHAPSGFSLTDSRLCAGCHQFGFSIRNDKGALVGLANRPQQNTYEEWRTYVAQSGDRRGCIDCHMKGKNHSMGGIRRLAALREAVSLIPDPQKAGLWVSLNDCGHRLPTGDIMRWLRLEASSEPLFEEPVVMYQFGRSLIRHRDTQGTSMAVAQDTSLVPGEKPLFVPFPKADRRGMPLFAWRLVYHLISPEQERQGLLPQGVSRLVVNAGPVQGAPP